MKNRHLIVAVIVAGLLLLSGVVQQNYMSRVELLQLPVYRVAVGSRKAVKVTGIEGEVPQVLRDELKSLH